MIFSPTIGLWLPETGDEANDLRDAIRENGTILDDAVLTGDSRLLTAALQAALAGTAGIPGAGNKFVTDEDLDTRQAALEAAIAAGASDLTYWGTNSVTTSQSRTNTAYGLLATADQISDVVVPASGLLVVDFWATWEQSVADAARAAIFLEGNQLKTPARLAAADGTPGAQAATHPASTGIESVLQSCPFGLIGHHLGSDYAGNVTTGQARAFVPGAGGGTGSTFEIGATSFTTDTHPMSASGPCVIEVDPGTYDISVQFKASAGSVTVKNRKLRVWTIG